MVDDLILNTTASFYLREARMSGAVVVRLFKDLRSLARKPSGNLFRQIREPLDGNLVSALCFSHERAPTFLADGLQVFDRVHGFVLIVERGEHVAVFKAGIELPADFKSRHLGRANPSNVEAAIATADAVFNKVRVRSTSSSRQGVQAKTVEARNLEDAMPMASAGGFFTQGYSVVREDGHFSATPGTGRITKRGDKGDAETAIRWAAAVMDQLAAGGVAGSSFIRNFARRVGLDALPDDATPMTFTVDTARLTELLLSDDPAIRFVRTDPATEHLIQLNVADVEAIITELDETLPIRRGRPDFRIGRGARLIGSIRIGKTRIALRKLVITSIRSIEVESTEYPLGADERRTPVSRYLDRENLFMVLFSDPNLAYVEGELFRTEMMRDGGANFLRHLIPNAALVASTSEKGEFVEGQEQFGEGSVFRAIADEISAMSDILVCDDLGDEWADFIGINTTRPPSINFFHGKHGALTLGASAFHVAVSQAEKNLGRLSLPHDAMSVKYESWSENYTSGSGVATDIAKIMRGGNAQDIRLGIDAVRSSPDAVRHVYIVTSSLSKAAVEAAFAGIAAGGRPSAHFVQLYWLLTHYYSACAEMTAVGFIVCQP